MQAWNIPLAPDLSPEASERYRGIELWKNLCRKGMPPGCALECVIDAFGHSVSYWYRWNARVVKENSLAGLECKSRRPNRVREKSWDPRVVARITFLRNHVDTCRWGARKIHWELQKERLCPPSVATCERIIAYLKETGAIRQPDTQFVYRKPKKYNRIHAQGYKKKQHGNLSRIQIDGDRYCILGKVFYNFSAIHINTRYLWSRAYSRASAVCGRDFVMRILATMPAEIPYDAIQIDGGSEFKKEFETYCKQMGIRLLVNRPRTPKQNAYVERVHRTIDEEFYQTREVPDTLAGINEELAYWVETYNMFRPHAGIGYVTPCEKIEELSRMGGYQGRG